MAVRGHLLWAEADLVQEWVMSGGEKFLRRSEVLARCGIGKSTLYRLIADRQFPAGCRLSERTVAWPETEIDAWIEDRKGHRVEVGGG